jgi:serine/threonine protein kinase/tetratricopeptide (TPR) repeat protein
MPEPERIGHFRLIRPLGAGGMGEVFLAHDERLNRQVALKRLRTSSDTPPERNERFQREARIAARLRHPAIVQIYELLSEGGIDCIVMEYVEGEDLRQRLQVAPLSVHETLGIGQQIALAMAEAHDQGIIHRDLKTENVLITRSGQVKITDFGIAKDLRDEPLTAEGHMMGTYRSMSPEQVLGRTVDHRSDLFSFGVLLYESLAGTSPFRAETPFLTLERVVHASPRPIQSLLPGLPGALAALIDQLLQKEPFLRPRNFHEVADALADIESESADKPCTRTPPARRPPLDTDGDTMATGNLAPTPASDAALDQAMGAATETLTPGLRPVARVADSRAASGTAETEPLTPESADPARPAARATRVQDAAPASQSSAPPDARLQRSAPPSARLLLPRARSRRVAVLTATGVAIASALGVSYGIWRETSEPPKRLRIAVARPRIEAPPELAKADDLMAVAVRLAIVRGLLSLDGIDALPLDDIDEVINGYEQGNGRQPFQDALMRAVGADGLVTASLACTMQRCHISLQRIVDGSIAGEPAVFEVSSGDVGSLDQPVIAHLPHLFPGYRFRDRATVVRVEPEDYKEFLRLRKAYWEDQRGPATDEVLGRLESIRERSQGFLELYRFEAELLQHRYRQTGDRSALERALALIQEAEKQAPDAYAILVSRFQIALEAGKPDLAQDALRRLDTLDPGSGSTLLMHGRWSIYRGEHEKAVEELERAAARDSSWRILYWLAFAEQKLGRWDAADAHLAQLLERSPGNYAGLSLEARAALDRGNPACAAKVYGELVARRRYYQECNNLGVAQMGLDRYEEAVESFRCALAIRPDSAVAAFNLAEALKLSGDEEAASEQFQQTVTLARAAKDRRTNVWIMQEAMALAHLAGSQPALAGDARALTKQVLEATASKQFLYEAAVVHALLGDQDQAVAHVRTLLDQGKSPEWFRYPWFNAVREHPDLRQRLDYRPPASACE